MNTKSFIIYIIFYVVMANPVSSQELILSEKPIPLKHALFGFSTSVFENWAIVGAPQEDRGNVQSTGSAYIYRYDGEEWSIFQHIFLDEQADFSSFGISVHASNNQMFVGATGDHQGAFFSGAVHFFQYNDSSWIEVQKIKPNDPISGSQFGHAMSVYDSTLAISAYQANGMKSKSGAVYLYRLKNNNWIQKAKILAEDGASNDFFGSDVSLLNSNTIAIGARNADGNKERSGVVYIFNEDEGGEWNQVAKLYNEFGDSGDLFGYKVETTRLKQGDNDESSILLVGSPSSKHENIRTGSVFVYRESKQEQTWRLVNTLRHASSDHNDSFGISLAANSKGLLYVGASQSSNGLIQKTGNVYQYNLTAILDANTDFDDNLLEISGTQEYDSFGYEISTYGNTLIVSSPHSDKSKSNSGEIHFFAQNSVNNEVENSEEILGFKLSQNYPNPFNPSTTITYSLPYAAEVQLFVVNVLGQKVATLINERKTAGQHIINFDASSLSSGVYFYTLESDGFTQTYKMLLVK